MPLFGFLVLDERYLPLLHEMKEDPDPKVRRVALHLEEDALEVSVVADERANDFERNRPGGWEPAR
ncbi:MAG: hypothetical protein ACRD2W_12100 [Acidimicrobiales bacterium]